MSKIVNSKKASKFSGGSDLMNAFEGVGFVYMTVTENNSKHAAIAAYRLRTDEDFDNEIVELENGAMIEFSVSAKGNGHVPVTQVLNEKGEIIKRWLPMGNIVESFANKYMSVDFWQPLENITEIELSELADLMEITATKSVVRVMRVHFKKDKDNGSTKVIKILKNDEMPVYGKTKAPKKEEPKKKEVVEM